jgi:Trypsin-like peptidase domain
VHVDHRTIARLIPEGEPPRELVPESARFLASNLRDRQDLYRSYLWASALLNLGFQSPLPVPPRFVHASAGLVPVNPQFPMGTAINGVAFGVYVLAEGEGDETIQLLRVAGREFPVVTNYGRIELHGSPPNPYNAVSTCWVRNLGASTSWKSGILTCRHAVRTLPMGSNVPLQASVHHTKPVSSTLADIDSCTIDAAVLEIKSSDWPTGLNKMPIARPSAPGQAVKFEDRKGWTHSGYILRVFNYNTYIGNLYGQRVIADCHAEAGDSGSFLVDTTTNQAVGIYMGTIPDGKGGSDGIFQDLAQVESFFQVEVYY